MLLSTTGRYCSKAAQRLSKAAQWHVTTIGIKVKAIAYMLFITLLALDETDT